MEGNPSRRPINLSVEFESKCRANAFPRRDRFASVVHGRKRRGEDRVKSTVKSTPLKGPISIGGNPGASAI
jgi:hypothetical protein